MRYLISVGLTQYLMVERIRRYLISVCLILYLTVERIMRYLILVGLIQYLTVERIMRYLVGWLVCWLVGGLVGWFMCGPLAASPQILVHGARRSPGPPPHTLGIQPETTANPVNQWHILSSTCTRATHSTQNTVTNHQKTPTPGSRSRPLHPSDIFPLKTTQDMCDAAPNGRDSFLPPSPCPALWWVPIPRYGHICQTLNEWRCLAIHSYSVISLLLWVSKFSYLQKNASLWSRQVTVALCTSRVQPVVPPRMRAPAGVC